MIGGLPKVRLIYAPTQSLYRTNCFTTDAKKTEAEKAEEQDAEILAAIASRRKLASDLELAKGVQYTDPLKTSYADNFGITISLWY